jgi:hypothetical protein
MLLKKLWSKPEKICSRHGYVETYFFLLKIDTHSFKIGPLDVEII